MDDQELRHAFAELKAVPRPSDAEAEDDELDDIIFELYGAEPFIAGLASSALNGVDPLPYADTDLSEYRRRLDSLDPDAGDVGARRATDRYLRALERVVQALAGYPRRGPSLPPDGSST